ncbi:MAG: hypothetical protein ACLP1X_16310 [Polyangiaceae bacterium]
MFARGVALALGIAAGSATVLAAAETDRPVALTVVGHGAIRFRLAVGVTAPCDSSENRMLFDGWLMPGRYEWGTGADAICYQYTSGALRESNWSESRVVGTLIRHVGPTKIVVSTE